MIPYNGIPSITRENIMTNRHALGTVVIALMLLLASCADYPEGPFHRRDDDDDHDSTGQVDTTGGGSTDTTGNTGGGTGSRDSSVCFTRDVLPILITNCTMAECHDADRPEEGINLTTYDAIIHGRETIVVPGSPSKSKLYESIVTDESDERMPPPPRSLTNAQIATIERWIREGAKNRDCSADNGGCNTSNVTFTSTIAPIMTTWCTGCHGGSSPSAGINLTQRSTVEAQARSGALLGSVMHATGYASMPPGSQRLDDCSIAQIKAWIDTGLK